MSKVASPVTGKPYGLTAVRRAWRIARSGVYRHRTPPASPPRRRGPMGASPDAALTAAIKAVLAASPFYGEGYLKVWARLRYAGIRTSLRRVLRLMREHDTTCWRLAGSAHRAAHVATTAPSFRIPSTPCGAPTLPPPSGPAAVFIAVDHCSAECVGIHAHARATRFEALEPIRQGVRRYFGGFAANVAHGCGSGTITISATCSPARR